MATLDNSLAESLSDQILAVRDFYLDELILEFKNLGSWREDSLSAWKDKSVPIVFEAQNTAMDIANAVIDMQLEILLDGEFSTVYPPRESVTGSAVRNGVPPDVVYGRAFKPIWQSTGNGAPIDQAVQHGISRLTEMFDVDLSRVVDHTSIERFANENRIVGYRRVLSGVHNCALCILASTQTYHKRELKGIHPHCKCTVVPVLSFEQPNALDRVLIDQVHQQIQDRFGISDRAGRQIDYRHIVMVRNHGELGPSLTFRDYNFTGPKALKTPGE